MGIWLSDLKSRVLDRQAAGETIIQESLCSESLRGSAVHRDSFIGVQEIARIYFQFCHWLIRWTSHKYLNASCWFPFPPFFCLVCSEWGRDCYTHFIYCLAQGALSSVRGLQVLLQDELFNLWLKAHYLKNIWSYLHAEIISNSKKFLLSVQKIQLYCCLSEYSFLTTTLS